MRVVIFLKSGQEHTGVWNQKIYGKGKDKAVYLVVDTKSMYFLKRDIRCIVSLDDSKEIEEPEIKGRIFYRVTRGTHAQSATRRIEILKDIESDQLSKAEIAKKHGVSRQYIYFLKHKHCRIGSLEN